MFGRVRQKSSLTCFLSSNGCCQSILLPACSLKIETLRKGSWFNFKSNINKLSLIYQMLYCSYHSVLLDNTGSTHTKNWSTRSTNKATSTVILYLILWWFLKSAVVVDFYRVLRFVTLWVKVGLDLQISRISWVSGQLGSKGID